MAHPLAWWAAFLYLALPPDWVMATIYQWLLAPDGETELVCLYTLDTGGGGQAKGQDDCPPAQLESFPDAVTGGRMLDKMGSDMLFLPLPVSR